MSTFEDELLDLPLHDIWIVQFPNTSFECTTRILHHMPLCESLMECVLSENKSSAISTSTATTTTINAKEKKSTRHVEMLSRQ